MIAADKSVDSVDDRRYEEPSAQNPQWWCNFCDFRTDDAQVYLAHSCADVLAARGVAIEPTGRNECR